MLSLLLSSFVFSDCDDVLFQFLVFVVFVFLFVIIEWVVDCQSDSWEALFSLKQPFCNESDGWKFEVVGQLKFVICVVVVAAIVDLPKSVLVPCSHGCCCQ